MTQAALPFDICAKRHRGNAASVAANPSRERKRTQRERVLCSLRIEPLTSKEIAFDLGYPLHCVSGRLSELLALGLIERTGERRDGAAVVRAKA